VPWLRPSCVVNDHFILWAEHRNDTFPYISTTTVVSRYALQSGDLLIFALDALRDSMPSVQEERLKVIVSLASGQDAEQLDHARLTVGANDNPAELLIKNILCVERYRADGTALYNERKRRYSRCPRRFGVGRSGWIGYLICASRPNVRRHESISKGVLYANHACL